MDDMISRRAAIDAICEDGTQRERQGQYSMTMVDRKYRDIEILEALPSAQSGCEDAVSRKAVAGIYTALWEIIGTIMDRNEWDDVCHTTANELLSVTPKQPGWIPCSTALPEHDGEYLVTKKSFGWNCKEYIETDIARYEKKDGWHKADQVLAWQLLPTPYREGGQE